MEEEGTCSRSAAWRRRVRVPYPLRVGRPRLRSRCVAAAGEGAIILQVVLQSVRIRCIVSERSESLPASPANSTVHIREMRFAISSTPSISASSYS